ncbi:hypothetical protein POK33_37845 [Burkholderia cenocepacia]|uniref:hypothetical protein n=1 Tax=Burkholderia cenocepacia TaxID=95486 RepID=UPI0023B9FDF6|nr:hypothetical protein [Burkholderia cenocepacia]MDF0506520.1 hypothetical protein [Burkholderia cenocepacia]
MAARKSAEVIRAVALVTTGKCKTVQQAATKAGVAATSIYRDAVYLAWKAQRDAAAGKAK